MKLYFADGTCSLSPHIVLQELGLDYDLVRVDNRTKQTSEGVDFRTVNPKGYVAALRIGGGAVLTEGPVLVQYLADLRPDHGLAPPPGTLERLRLQEWLSFVTSELHAGAHPLFRSDLPEEALAFFRARFLDRLGLVEATLTQRAFLLGDEFSAADAYLYTVLDWTPRFGIDLARWPSTDAYVRGVAARPSVGAARAREAAAPAIPA
jgi:glutathione S-transferase